MNLRKQHTEIVEITSEGETYRFTFARVQALGLMRYQSYRSVADKFVKEMTGKTPEQILSAVKRQDVASADFNYIDISLTAAIWPRVLSSLQSISVCKADSDPALAESWVNQPIPEEWANVEKFFESVDREYLPLFDAAASECNRDLWFVAQTPAAKKKED